MNLSLKMLPVEDARRGEEVVLTSGGMPPVWWPGATLILDPFNAGNRVVLDAALPAVE